MFDNRCFPTCQFYTGFRAGKHLALKPVNCTTTLAAEIKYEEENNADATGCITAAQFKGNFAT
jgi:hypothetical protein